jgi:hypothetical protein
MEPVPLRLHVVDQYLPKTTFNDVVRTELLPIALAEISKRLLIRRPVKGNLLLPVSCLWYHSSNKCLENTFHPKVETCGPENLGMFYKKDLFASYETCKLNSDENDSLTCPKTTTGSINLLEPVANFVTCLLLA